MVNSKEFKREYFEGSNSNYKNGYVLDQEREHIFSYYISKFLDGISFRNILDVGCATGLFLRVIKNKYSKVKLFGVDISDYAINQCKSSLDGTFKVNDISKEFLPFKNKFDLITSFEVIEHLEQENNYLRNINRSLKKGSYFLFSCPMKSGLIRRILDKDTTHINLQDSNYYFLTLPKFGFKIRKYQKIALWSQIPTAVLRNFLNYRGKPITTNLDFLTQDQIYLCEKIKDVNK